MREMSNWHDKELQVLVLVVLVLVTRCVTLTNVDPQQGGEKTSARGPDYRKKCRLKRECMERIRRQCDSEQGVRKQHDSMPNVARHESGQRCEHTI